MGKTIDLNCSDEISKSFNHLIDKALEPSGLDIILTEAHKKIIFDILEHTENKEDAVDFICGYKKMVKERKRSKTIADKAALFLNQNAKPNEVDEDWLNVFFDKAKLISSENMQTLWGKILAEEVNAPGTISLSLLNTISMMGRNQALSFCNLVRFCFREFHSDIYHPLIFIQSDPLAYQNSNITFPILKDLERLGLIDCNFTNEFCFKKKKVLAAGNHVIEIFGNPHNRDKILAGNVILTDNGKLLLTLVGDEYKKYRPDVFDFTISKLKKHNCKILANGKEI